MLPKLWLALRSLDMVLSVGICLLLCDIDGDGGDGGLEVVRTDTGWL